MKHPRKKSLEWAAGFLLVLFSTAPMVVAHDARTEIRSIWITRWDYKTEDDIRRAVKWSARLGLTRIFFQVRGRADAFYRSNLEPWGEELGESDPDFDPLQVAIEAARAAGVELHAWINVMPGWKGSKPPTSQAHVFHRHPEWFLVDKHARRHLLNDADYTVINPCLPEVRAYIVGVVKDLIGRYPVAGLQLDYIRFIGRDVDRGIDFPYDPQTLRLFRKYSGGSPAELPAEWDKWRGLAVDTLVYRISEAARKARPGLRLSVAAIQDYSRARTGLFQDVNKWQGFGWIDEIYPMTYHKAEAPFRASALKAIESGGARRVMPGIGVYLFDSAAELSAQIKTTRALGAGGYALFAYANFFPSASHESRPDARGRQLRAELRAELQALNGIPASARSSSVVQSNVPRS